jgi:hypothetical protein
MKRPNKKEYDFNDNIEGVRYAKDMNDYADKLEEQLRLYFVSSSYAVQKVHFYSMISTYLKASEEVENGIYDPIEDALQEIQQKYLIIQKA